MTKVVVDKLPSKPDECPFHFEGGCQISVHLGRIFEKCNDVCSHLIDFKELMKCP